MNNSKRSLAIYLSAAAILAIPLIAMQFTNEVKWEFFDFLIMGVLLFATAFCINFILNKIPERGKRFFFIAISLIVLLLIWAELAVGIFGTPFAGS